MTRKLATALLAALALFAFQLVHAQTSSAATGLACAQDGLETVASDAADYPPGSTAHFTGTGLRPRLRRPAERLAAGRRHRHP